MNCFDNVLFGFFVLSFILFCIFCIEYYEEFFIEELLVYIVKDYIVENFGVDVVNEVWSVKE